MGAYTITRFCDTYGVRTTTAYNLLKAGKIHGVKAGRRSLITRESAEAWFASLPPLHPEQPQREVA